MSLIMACCLRCVTEIGEQDQLYIISDFGSDILTLIEFHLGVQAEEEGILCAECFEAIIQDLPYQYEWINRQDDNTCTLCRSTLFRRRSHSLQEVAREYVADIIMPRQVYDNALVCNPCWMQIYQALRPQGITITASTNNCVCCDRSLSRTRRHSLPEGPEHNFISSRIYPREIPLAGRVCYACWVAARRHVQREQNIVIEAAADNVYEDQDTCVCCQSPLLRRHRHRLLPGPERDEVSQRIHPRQLPEHSAQVCDNCWHQAQENVQSRMNEPQIPPPIPPPSSNVIMTLSGFYHTTHSSTRCFVPECTNPERKIVPTYLKLRIFKSQNVFVTENARICNYHKSIYDWEFLQEHEFSNSFSIFEIEALLRLSQTDEENLIMDFESMDNIPDHIFHYWTGVTKGNFVNIFNVIRPALTYKAPKTVLGVYLIKIRTGDSHQRIASLMGMSKAKVIKLLNLAREALLRLFVPLHMGINHMTRAELISHNLLIPEGLFGDNEQVPITICDGTYIYLQKSSNYLFQKKTYSLHKYRNLVKPFLMVASDGYILDVLGPYPATESDAEIMKALLQNENSPYRNYFQSGDVFILDRGFRDALPLMEQLGYRVYKPESLRHGEAQLPTIRANQSRCVTLCRWVVEVVNGRFKRDFKILRQNYFNCAATHLMDDVRICAALINAFHPLIINREDANLILDRALSRLEMPNLLADLINSNRINRYRSQFQRIDAEVGLEIFPVMAMDDLILFGLGTYQIKQAKSYYGEHLRDHGTFTVEISNELEVIAQVVQSQYDPFLIRARIRSRHQTGKIYYTYILIQNEGSCWDEKIVSYYCNCVCGQRTVGCCAHVMTVVWYLGWARHEPSIEAPASFLDGILVREDIENEELN